MLRGFKFLRHGSSSRLWAALLLLTANHSATGADEAQTLRIGGSGTDLATVRMLATDFAGAHSDARIDVQPSLGSGGGIKGVAMGQLEIGLTSRELTPKELSLPLLAILYARTPLVFAVAQDAAVSEVTTAQIQGLYSGDVSRWPDNTPARPVLRPASDSDTLLLREAFPELIAAIDAAGTRRGVPTAATDQDAADMLTSIPGAFGTSTLALILAERRPLKPLPLNGIAPTPANLAAGRYPLAKNLYFVVPSSPSSLALRFLNYVRSPAARRTLEQTGHQPIEFPAL